MKIYLTICILLSILDSNVESARLSITPSTNVQVGSTAVTLKCEAAASAGYNTLYNLEIQKQKNLHQPETQIALVNGRGTTDSTSKYTITSSYDITAAPTSSFLQAVLNNPSCSDVAEYVCISKGEATTGDGLESDRKNLTVQSNPETPQMFVDPDYSVSGFLVNANVSMRCKGNVGNPQKLWSWRWKRSGSSFWQDFNSSTDITDGEVTPPTSTRCSYASSSTLRYTIKSQDHEMMIMCRIDNNDEYNANYTIKLRGAPDRTEVPRFHGGEDGLSKVETGLSKLETGLTVALVISLILNIGLVTMLIIKTTRPKDKPTVTTPSHPNYNNNEQRIKERTDKPYDNLHVYNNSDTEQNYSSLSRF